LQNPYVSSSTHFKPKLAVILSRFPFPLEKGDKLRAYYQIKELSKQYKITLFTITENKVIPADYAELAGLCEDIHIYQLNRFEMLFQLANCVFNDNPFQVGYFKSNKAKRDISKQLHELKPDHIYCQLIRAAEYVKDYHYCAKTLDYMDAFSAGVERRISKVPFYKKWIFKSEAARLKRYERKIFDYFEHKTIISEQDRELILHPNRKEIICIPNGIDASFLNYKAEETSHDLVFIGNMSYPPNVEAVEYISDLLNDLPNTTCLIAGANPNPTVKKICAQNKQIEMRGWVKDIRSAYCDGKIFVAPMMIGTGMQNKLLEAMALGIPCITTSLANNAIKAEHMNSIIVADSREAFIRSIQLLLNNKELYQLIARNAKDFVQNSYSWEESTRHLIERCLQHD
jgi:glycosyltransferase involved in cell wall biosynthesis